MRQEILSCAKRLFDLPLGQKQAMAISKSIDMSKRGYRAIGDQKLDVMLDTKEGFYLGFDISVGDPKAGTL